jgi:hypothetical protein
MDKYSKLTYLLKTKLVRERVAYKVVEKKLVMTFCFIIIIIFPELWKLNDVIDS